MDHRITIQIRFIACLIILFLNGCTTTIYQPGSYGLDLSFQETSLPSNATPQNAEFVVGEFDSSAFAAVDVALNADVAVDSRPFGNFLRAKTWEALQESGWFRRVTLQPSGSSNSYLEVSGKIVDLSLTNDLGSSCTARATLRATILHMPLMNEVDSFIISQEGVAPGELTFDAALDPLARNLAVTLVRSIAQSIKTSLYVQAHPELKTMPLSGSVQPETGGAPAASIPVGSPTRSSNRGPSVGGGGTKWAVVIGISSYRYAAADGLSNLIYADEDAIAFSNALKNMGWKKHHIKLLVNEEATHRNILIALRSWLTKAGSEDQIILFWAGHGYHHPDDPEKVYFAAHDTEIHIPATGYRMDEVRRALEEVGSKNVIVFADTCHAGKLITRGGRGISILPKIHKMQREQNIPNGWIFMVGADTDRKALEHTAWKNGAFTHTLIKGLTREADGFQSAGVQDGIVTMGELKDYMRNAMPNDTQKILGIAIHPVITTSSGDPDIWNLTLQITDQR